MIPLPAHSAAAIQPRREAALEQIHTCLDEFHQEWSDSCGSVAEYTRVVKMQQFLRTPNGMCLIVCRSAQGCMQLRTRKPPKNMRAKHKGCCSRWGHERNVQHCAVLSHLRRELASAKLRISASILDNRILRQNSQ